MKNSKDLQKIKGDASFRTFYRSKKNNSIVVYAKKEKKKNLLIYDAVNKILIKNKISAPNLISHSYKKNFIEIEDFGNLTIFNLLKKKKINKFKVYMQIIYLLNKLQSIRQKKIINFNNKAYEIPKYTSKILEKKDMLISEWYLVNTLKKSKQKKFKK